MWSCPSPSADEGRKREGQRPADDQPPGSRSYVRLPKIPPRGWQVNHRPVTFIAFSSSVRSMKKARVLAPLYGGQWTMNVPSWSPDGRSVVFVSYTYGNPEIRDQETHRWDEWQDNCAS